MPVFVCWDPDLVPSSVAEAAEYPAGKETLQFKPITHEDRIEYFAHASNMQLGRVKKLYLQWARCKGPMSSQCQELNRLFSQCVDANRIQIPEPLTRLPDNTKNPPFILDILHDAASDHIKRRDTKISALDLSNAEMLESMLAEDNSMSEFEKAKLALRWCQMNTVPFADVSLYLDPRKLQSQERTWFLSLLPPNSKAPALVMNDLLHSGILDLTELQYFGLQRARIRWRAVFDSRKDRLSTLMNNIDRTFGAFTRKLLVLNFSERLSVAIYLPLKIEHGDDFAVGQRVRLFSFPHSQKGDRGHRRVVPTKSNSRLYYDHNKLELYEGQRRDTFVFLNRSQGDDSKYRSIQGQGERARARQATIDAGVNYDWRTSIALAKFSQDLARHIGRLNREGVSAAVSDSSCSKT